MLGPSGEGLGLRNPEARVRQVILILVQPQPPAVAATRMTPTRWVWALLRRIVRVR